MFLARIITYIPKYNAAARSPSPISALLWRLIMFWGKHLG